MTIHKEVMENLGSIHRALCRINQSTQMKEIFGIMKYDHWYKQTVGRGFDSAKLKLFLASIGHNLYHNKQMRLQKTLRRVFWDKCKYAF